MDASKLLRQDVAFVIIALILAYGIYDTAGVALNTEVPMVAVTSGSMEPTLHRGDMIVVQGVPYTEIDVGDIIVYRTQGSAVPIVHRVIRKNATAVQTKGDALRTQHPFEKHVAPDQILGRSRLAVPYIGYVKLLPTCLFLRAQGRTGGGFQRVCPAGQL